MFFCSNLIALKAQAEQAIARVAWVEQNGDYNELYVAQLFHDSWVKDAQPSYRTNNAITAPTIGADHHLNPILVWTEQRQQRFVLMIAYGADTEPHSTLRWSKAELLSDHGAENFGATLIRTFNDTTWVFWSASTDGPSDIYASKRSAEGWSTARRINPDNNVPDNHPNAKLDKYGNILLNWSVYNLETNRYETSHYKIDTKTDKVIDINPGSSNAPSDSEQIKDTNKAIEPSELDLTDITLPPFIPNTAISGLHFPTNKFIQSLRVSN